MDQLKPTELKMDRRAPTPADSIPPWHPRVLAYALAVVSTVAVLLASLGLASLNGSAPVLMIFLFPIILSAYAGGFGPGFTATALAALLANYFILPPLHSFHIVHATDGMRWGLLIVIGLLVSSMSEALHRSRRRAEEGWSRYAITLGSIGDGVITTDQRGRVTLMNAEAERLTGWTNVEAAGQTLSAVFHIIHEQTRQPLEDPLIKILRCGAAASLASPTLLRARNGKETPIENNGAPIKQSDGKIIGVVLVFHDCAEKKKTGAALALFRTLIDRSNDSIEVVDPATGRFLDFNENAFLNLGYTREEMLALTVCDIDPAITPSGREQTLSKLRESGSLIMEGVHRRKDGTTFPVELNKKLVRLDREYIVTVARDITERRASEQALRESEAWLSTIFRHSPVGIVISEFADGKIVDVNEAFAGIHGYTREEIIGRQPAELQMWANPDERDEMIRQLRACGHCKDLEIKARKKSGETCDLLISVEMIGMAGKRFTLGLARDITERKRGEEMQKRLATAVEQAAEDIMITDATGKIIYVNPAFENITGYSRASAIGCNPRFLKSGKHDAAFYQKMWSVLSRGEVWSGRIINKRKNGTVFEEEATISPIRDSTGKITNYVGVRRDVTREVALETQLRQSQKMDAIGQLAGGIAHDFNNLLTAIRGNASLLLLSDAAQSGETSDCAQQIVEAAERAANLTRQLLMFSRKQVIQPIRLDLNEVVAQMTKLLQRILGEDISLASNYAPGLPAIQADTGMIEQILLNLAVNSRDAMPKGGQLIISTGTETVNAETGGQNDGAPAGLYVRLTVADTGCGIPAEHLLRIFEPFFTTKEVGKGTGLGLATVHGIVQQHNGRITVSSEAGRGTTFRIYFPVMAGTPTEIKSRPAISSLPRGTETILVVEDEVIVRLAVGNLLQRFGYTVLLAASGVEAITVWQNEKYRVQLLLTDIVMPDGMTGYELARQLQDEKPELKVIYTSGYSGDLADKRLTMVEGVNFLQKPYAPRKLAEALRRNLDSR